MLDEIRDELAALFGSRTQAEWTRRLEHVNCCFSPVLSLEETAGHDQFKARGMFVPRDEGTQYAFPLKFSDFEFSVRRPAPAHGEHTEELLAELGYTAAERADLKHRGVDLSRRSKGQFGRKFRCAPWR